MKDNIRRSVIAGSWYPGKPETLEKDLNSYLEKADIPELPAKPSAIISPHAGYVYSGPVAAYAYKAIEGYQYKRAVVISPSHRAYFPFVSVWAKGSFITPLGSISIDEDLSSALMSTSNFIRDERAPHLSEHALEIQLPFMQHSLKEFSLCALIMGEQNIQICSELASTLARTIKNPEETLLVASSDLSHFHHSEKASVMDTNLVRMISAYDIDGFEKAISSGKSEACGAGPIMTALLYSKAIGKTNIKVLKYANSGDTTGDRSSVVGYLSAVIY